MDANIILAELKNKHSGWTKLAGSLIPAVTPQHVRAVAKGTHESIRVAKAIANEIGKPVETVFPDKKQYHAKANNGKQQRPRPKKSRVKKKVAA